MIKENYKFTDLQGKEISQPRKSSRSVEIDGNKLFCGHRFLLKQKLYGDKRCIYCGKWFHWSQDDAAKWVKARNIDSMNVDSVLEPLHCGNTACDDYHHRYLRHQDKLASQKLAEDEYRMNELWKTCKKAGVIA